jgi:hypothetical protein
LPPVGPPLPLTIAGEAAFLDSSLQAVINGVPAADDAHTYAAWLVGPDGAAQPADAQFADGSLSVTFVDPQNRNLLSMYDQFSVTLEPNPDPSPEVPTLPILYVSRAPDAILGEVRRLDIRTRGAATTASVVAGLRTQAKIHDDHLGFALDAVGDNSLPAAKLHAEHSINVLAGEGSPDFQDWDVSGAPTNPGDGFGLLPYLRLGLALAESELANPDLSPESETRLQGLVDHLTATISSPELRGRGEGMTAVDSIDGLPAGGSVGNAAAARTFGRGGTPHRELGLRLWAPVRAVTVAHSLSPRGRRSATV